jgi:hypothetical protein
MDTPNREKQIAKEYIVDNFLDLELIFYNKESARLKNVKFPFYDGGLTPILMYYTRKYKLPMNLPQFINNIKGTTIYQITSNFYKYNASYNLVSKNDYDLFSVEFIKNYFFYSKYYNFSVPYDRITDFYNKKITNIDGDYLWIDELPKILLSLIAIKENKSLGIKGDPVKVDKLFNGFYNSIKTITEKYLVEAPSKKKINYLRIFWMYQILEPKSEVVKNEGVNHVMYLIKSRKKKSLWKFIDINYLDNWILYGIIKDYLYENFENFLNTYSLKEITQGMIFEEFENPPTKSKSKSKTKTNSNSKSKDKVNKKEKFDDVKKKESPGFWKTLLIWIGLPILIFLGVRIMIFFWSQIFTMVKK